MSGDTLTGQATPASGELATTGAAQDNAATASPQTDGGAGGEGGNPDVPAAKSFTQKDVDEIVKRAKAATESKTERRILRTLERLQPQSHQQQARQESQPHAPNDGRPSRTQGESDDAYFDRLADWKLDQREAKTAAERHREQAQALGKKTNDIYAQAEKLGDDFDRDSFDENLTKPIAEALVESDDAARLMHFLGAHPEEMQRISQLTPARQAAELGKLEGKLALEAQKPKPTAPPRSNAPQALAPTKGSPPSNSVPDPGDTKAYIKWANAQERAAR